jgi:hypothetical protein
MKDGVTPTTSTSPCGVFSRVARISGAKERNSQEAILK